MSGVLDSSGAFTLNNIPAALGYVVSVAATGFASKQVPGVTVSAGTTDMGTIALAAVGGPSRLVALAPDVNPSTTTVEVGGTAYRYYLALNSANQPQGGVTVSAQVSGGNPIPQSGDVSAYWPGQTAGVSDADGIVRVSIPASALGAFGIAQMVELSVAGQVQQTFQAEAVLRQYDQLWKHRVGGGVSGTLLGATIGGSVAYESQVRDTMQGSVATNQQITRIRSGQLSVGLDVGGGAKIVFGNLVAGDEASAGANRYGGADLSSTFHFAAASTLPSDNLMKLYVALGDDLALASGPARGIYELAATVYESAFLDSNLDSSEGEVRLGGDAEGDATFGFFNQQPGQGPKVGIDAQLSGNIEAIAGSGTSYGTEPESSYWLGLAESGSGVAIVGSTFASYPTVSGLQLSPLVDASGEAELEFRGTVVTPTGSKEIRSVQIDQTASVGANIAFWLSQWTNYDGQWGNQNREYSETLTFTPSGSGSIYQLLDPLLQDVSAGVAGIVIGPATPAELLNNVLNTLTAEGSLTYQRSLYVFDQFPIEADADLDPLANGISITLQGDLEKGAEAVNERGIVWQCRMRMPLESYPPITSDMLPQQSVIEKELTWLRYANASGLVAQALNQFTTAVAAGANTVIPELLT